MKPETYNVSITALNILDGMDHHKNWEVLQPAWEKEGHGFLEFCGWITDLATISEELLIQRNPQNFSGVYDYEVAYELGEQILQYVVSKGSLPSEVDCRRWLSVLADDFFRRNAHEF